MNDFNQRSNRSKCERPKFDSTTSLLAMDMDTEAKTALKTILSTCLKVRDDIKPLSILLSTIYANESVTRGLAASLREKLSNTPIVMNREVMIQQCDLILESLWMIDSISTEWLGHLEDAIAKSQSSSGGRA